MNYYKREVTIKFFVFIFLSIFSLMALAEPRNINEAKKEVFQYIHTKQYHSDLAKSYKKAKNILSKAIRTKNKNETLAVVLDIDETVLSNLPFMEENNFGWSKTNMAKQLSRNDMPALQPALDFYQYAYSNKVKIVFLTARPTIYKDNTIENLKQAGFHIWERLIFRPKATSHGSSAKYKAVMREQLVNDGFTIVLNIGDQHSDLVGGFADHSIKLANPFYSTA